MEHKEALLESLAELRSAHDKASRLMAGIAAIAALAAKGGASLPSPAQLRQYEQLVAQAQRHAAHCQHLLQGGLPGRPAEGQGAQPYMH